MTTLHGRSNRQRWYLRGVIALCGVTALSVSVAACGSDSSSTNNTEVDSTESSVAPDSTVRIVVTNAVLGSVVQEVVGSNSVSVIIPNGKDPHDYEPSAQDVTEMMNADLIVETGLAYDVGLDKTIDSARDKGVRVFTVADHVVLKDLEGDVVADHSEEEHDDHDHGDHGDEGADPHFLSDPVTMKQMIPVLVATLEEATGNQYSTATDELTQMFENTHSEVQSVMTSLGQTPCTLVTGHESLRYFADRYGCEVVGAIIPGASSTAEATAGALAGLKEKAIEAEVRAIFVDEGTPSKVADQIASEVGVGVYELASHTVPDAGGYMAYVVAIANVIVEGLTAA